MEKTIILCIECSGEIDFVKKFPIQIGNRQPKDTFRCKECGRLHFLAVQGVENTERQKAYSIDGELIYKTR